MTPACSLKPSRELYENRVRSLSCVIQNSADAGFMQDVGLTSSKDERPARCVGLTQEEGALGTRSILANVVPGGVAPR